MKKILLSAVIALLLSFPVAAQTISPDKLASLVTSLNELAATLKKLSAALEKFKSSGSGGDQAQQQEEAAPQKEEQAVSPKKESPADSSGGQQQAKCKNGTAAQEKAFRASAVTDAGLSKDDAAGLNLKCRDKGSETATTVQEDTGSDTGGNTDSGSQTVTPASGDVGIGLPEVDQWASLVDAAAKKYGYPDTNFLLAQIKWESQGQPGEISQDSPCGGEGQDSKSVGLFQVTKGCGEGQGLDLLDPAVNIDEGVRLQASNLKDIQERFPQCSAQDQIRMAAAGYVQGYDTITGCDQYSDQRQREYVDILNGFYNGNKNAGDGV